MDEFGSALSAADLAAAELEERLNALNLLKYVLDQGISDHHEVAQEALSAARRCASYLEGLEEALAANLVSDEPAEDD